MAALRAACYADRGRDSRRTAERVRSRGEDGKAKATKVRREDLKPGACLCDHCAGKCCRYFSLPIDTPTTWDDYDAIRWYLAHGETLVYVEKGTWYLARHDPLQVPDAATTAAGST